MYLLIQKTIPVCDIQQQFEEAYPYLKMEFFRFPQRKQPLSKYLMIQPVNSLRYFDTYYCNWKIDITKTRMVRQVEKDLESLFGLYIMICRKAGEKWIDTSLTNEWTLREQTEESERRANSILVQKRKQAA